MSPALAGGFWATREAPPVPFLPPFLPAEGAVMSRAEGVPRGCFPCRFYECQSLSTTWNILSVIVEEKSLLYWFSPFVFSSGLILLTIHVVTHTSLEAIHCFSLFSSSFPSKHSGSVSLITVENA